MKFGFSTDVCFACFTKDVAELKELVTTAEQSQFPDCDFLQQLKAAVTEAERCANVAIQLVNRKHRTRYGCIENEDLRPRKRRPQNKLT